MDGRKPTSTPTTVMTMITNTLRAGFPVADYEGLRSCSMIFICVADEILPATIQQLGDSPLDWAGRSVVLCDSPLASDSLHDLAVCGAYTAAINLAPGPKRMILADGHRMAISALAPRTSRKSCSMTKW